MHKPPVNMLLLTIHYGPCSLSLQCCLDDWFPSCYIGSFTLQGVLHIFEKPPCKRGCGVTLLNSSQDSHNVQVPGDDGVSHQFLN